MPFHFVPALHGRSGGRNGRGIWACGFAAAALAVASATAWAQEPQATPWERIGVYEGRTLYVDHTTSRKSGSMLRLRSYGGFHSDGRFRRRGTFRTWRRFT